MRHSELVILALLLPATVAAAAAAASRLRGTATAQPNQDSYMPEAYVSVFKDISSVSGTPENPWIKRSEGKQQTTLQGYVHGHGRPYYRPSGPYPGGNIPQGYTGVNGVAPGTPNLAPSGLSGYPGGVVPSPVGGVVVSGLGGF